MLAFIFMIKIEKKMNVAFQFLKTKLLIHLFSLIKNY